MNKGHLDCALSYEALLKTSAMKDSVRGEVWGWLGFYWLLYIIQSTSLMCQLSPIVNTPRIWKTFKLYQYAS